MEIIIRGDKIEVTKAMKDYIEEKLKRLDKYLENSDEVRATVVVRVSSHRQTVEITIPLHNYIIRSEETQDDFYAAVDKNFEIAGILNKDVVNNDVSRFVKIVTV
jgi:putative sigma-54 modulation protein